MKTIKAKNGQFRLKAYQYKDLSETAKEKVINEHINFWMEVLEYDQMSDNQKKAIDTAERMQTPWFTGSYFYDYCLPELLDEIERNHYLFDKDGNLLPTVYYVSDNKIIKTTFRYFGNEVEINPLFAS